MVFVACGLNHKTAPLAVREKIALATQMQADFLPGLVQSPLIREAAILSTCNRTELYCETDEPHQIMSHLAAHQSLATEEIKPYFYSHTGHHGIRHALRVASGLDSMMLGEPQILGQLKQAYQQASQLGTLKQNLRPVFQYIFRASKQIRSQSGIGNNPVSVAFAAVQLIAKRFKTLNALNVFVIGSGETASLVAKYLQKQGVTQFMVASRTLENAHKLAQDFSGKAVTISDIPLHLAKTDVVISATACPLPFITQSMVAHCMTERHQKPMFFLDLAVPRDIETNVASLPHVDLVNVDDLHAMTEKGMAERQNAARHAEQLVEIELENYRRWHRSLKANDAICHYRGEMQALAQHELQRAMQKITAGQSQEKVMIEFSERLINKILHGPTLGLREAALDNRDDLLDLAQYLFKQQQSSEAPHETIA